jgi:membrane protein implicated in regulation of membrane protease activity
MRRTRYTVFTIAATLLEEAALAAVVLWLLPRISINIPVWGLAIMMVALAAYSSVNYRLNTRALAKKPLSWPEIGRRGRTTTPISPKGYVRVDGELWHASSSSTIGAGEEIAIVGRDGMTLVVSPLESDDRARKDSHSSGR